MNPITPLRLVALGVNAALLAAIGVFFFVEQVRPIALPLIGVLLVVALITTYLRIREMRSAVTRVKEANDGVIPVNDPRRARILIYTRVGAFVAVAIAGFVVAGFAESPVRLAFVVAGVVVLALGVVQAIWAERMIRRGRPDPNHPRD